MAEDISLFKADGQEWGFRVTGGADFGTPLTIIKINKGSTGERAGLRVGDMVIAINDQPLSHMTHFQARDAISSAGNSCKATVVRGSIVQLPQLPVPQIDVQNGAENAQPTDNTGTEELGEVALPSLLVNLINSGIQEQPVDEDLNQEDQEVSDSWNLALPQHLVVTLKSVTPSQLDGRPSSPWEIIEERNTFVDQEEKEKNPSGGTPKPAAGETPKPTTEGKKTTKAKQGGKQGGKEVTVKGQGTAQGEAETKGKSEGAENNNQEAGKEGQSTTAESAEEHKEYTEEEIAEMMSGCAEVLVGKCIGVDFQKLPPDTDIMKSEVLHVLIDEKIRKPEKKLTTFQQRPARPRPRPKGEPEHPPPPYLPLKYKGTPKKKEEEVKTDGSADIVEADEATLNSEEGVEAAHEETQETIEGEQTEEHTEIGEEITNEHENMESSDQVAEPENAELIVADPADIESQLAEIQNQLAAIIQLPVEIQQHLTFIQTQLSKILEIRAAESTENQGGIVQLDSVEEEAIQEGEEHHEETEGEHTEGETDGDITDGEGVERGEEDEPVAEEEPQPEPEPEPEPEPTKTKKQDIQWRKDEESQQRNKPFFPLTPQPRPVQLPGGRHWFKPRDVYTEDFIAETLSGKEEVITGTTIGVDFRKFQANLDYLEKSSVYKMIHGGEVKRPLPGVFASRADVVRAKEDYISPCTDTETNFSLYKTKQVVGVGSSLDISVEYNN